jgi:hypothetical protein
MINSILQFFAISPFSGISFWYVWGDLAAVGIVIGLSLYVYLHSYYNATPALLYKILVLAPIAFIIPSVFFTLGNYATKLVMAPSLLILFILGLIGVVVSIAAAIMYGVNSKNFSSLSTCPYHGPYEGLYCPICANVDNAGGPTVPIEPYAKREDNTRIFQEPKTTGYLINQRSSNVYKLFDDSVIGRGQSSLSDAQKISVEADDYISRSHARIVFDKTRHKISDSSSKTGTFVNNEKIRGWTTLEEGDIIRIGKTNLKYTKNK